MNDRKPDPLLRCIGGELHWSVWASKDAPDDWFVSYGDMEDDTRLGRLSDVVCVVTALGWVGDDAAIPPHDAAVAQVSYILALWDVFPIHVLIEMMRMGVSAEDVIALVESGVELDNALLASLVGDSAA